MSERVCIVCQRRELDDDERQTCVSCIDHTRRALIEVERLYALLPAELTGRAGAASPLDSIRSNEEPIPGGDALVMLASGAARRSYDDQPDVQSVVGLLGRWEDDWRVHLGIYAATDPATVSGCAVFLLRGLAHMAQDHPAFDEFADDIRKLRGSLLEVTKSGYPQDRAAIRCENCGSTLRRDYLDPDRDDVPHPKREKVLVKLPGGKEVWEWQPDWNTHRRRVMAWNRRRMYLDQGGRREGWRCANRACDFECSETEYNLKVNAKMQEKALPVRDLALLLGVTASRVRQIVGKHEIKPAARDGKTPRYPVAEVMQHARPQQGLAS